MLTLQVPVVLKLCFTSHVHTLAIGRIGIDDIDFTVPFMPAEVLLGQCLQMGHFFRGVGRMFLKACLREQPFNIRHFVFLHGSATSQHQGDGNCAN
ncbi:conserved hypothetical protein [delta proteobacterium NaphS2]|nr:conserved hypothetical protein [delta proteobacterium NaphS2]